MTEEIERVYQFEDFLLDPSAKTLWRENERISLTPKVFDMLQLFVEHAGRLLGKDELMETLWQGRFVEESNLTFTIRMLRRALNDDAQHPRFIETVPRRGYRFIAEVKPCERQRVVNEPAHEILAPVKTRSYIAPSAVLLTICLVAALWFFRGQFHNIAQSAPILSAPILSKPFKCEPFSTTGRLHAVITPDGKYVAYTGEAEGKENIWLRQLETSENIQIVPPSEQHYLGLATSHDGNALYFVRRPQDEKTPSALYRVMTFGGIPIKLAEKLEGWISVSPDDKQISFVRCTYQPDDNCSLFVVGSDGKNERRLITRRRPIRMSDNQFSPDGKSIVFAEGQSSNGSSDFRLTRFDLATGADSQLSSRGFFNIENLKWLPDLTGLLVVAKESLNGRIRIWEVTTATGKAEALTRDATDYMTISLDLAADKMVATNASNTFRLYLAQAGDLKSGNVLTTARSVTFAPDGKLVYSANDGDIWTINRDGSEQRQLTSNSSTNFSPRLSPDGQYVFFASNRTGSNQVWRMNADGSNQIQLTKSEGGYPRLVTSDGKWVYFESGLHETLWQVATDGSEERQVSGNTALLATFSPNGRLVAYVYRDADGQQTRIGVLSLENLKVVKTFSLSEENSDPAAIAWASDNQSFFYVTPSHSKTSLWSQSMIGDAPRLVADLGDEEIQDFAISPDGNTFALIRGKWIHDALLIEGLK